VAIYRLLRREVFEPEDVRLLATLYEELTKTLGLTDQTAPVRQLIARKLIELAQAGERDAETLKELTLESIQTTPPQ
jgi:hypothetical protein